MDDFERCSPTACFFTVCPQGLHMLCGAISLDQAHSPIGKDAIHIQRLRPQANWRDCRGDPDEPVECAAHGRSQFCKLQKRGQAHLYRWRGAAICCATANSHARPLASGSRHPRLAKLGLLWRNRENRRRLNRGWCCQSAWCTAQTGRRFGHSDGPAKFWSLP